MEPFSIDLGSSRPVQGMVHLPPRPGQHPAVVICHGFKGFMDWGFFPYLADLLASRGFVTIRFNFSGSGVRPGDDRVSDFEAFKTATLTKDLAELTGLIDGLGTALAPGHIATDRIGVLGHSRGGGTTLLESARDTTAVKALVTWSAVATYQRYSEEEKRAWRLGGSIPVVNARTGQELEIGCEVLDDLDQNVGSLDLEAAARKRTVPWLLIHGTADETVPLSEAEVLHRSAQAAQAGTEFLRIEDGSHTFGSGHPFFGPTPQLIEAMNATQLWFRRHLM